MENSIQDIKKGLIEDIKKRLGDGAMEPQNADALIRMINLAPSIEDAQFIHLIGTKNCRTGFHFDCRLENFDKNSSIYFFEKNKELSIPAKDETKLTHKLVIGDNYKVLLNLLIEYKGQIDVIYIDPPYGKDDMGEFATTNYNNDISRDNLLSMLEFRLRIARELLSDTGIIFCSIDDKNQAYVKSLFDDIFKESNFLVNICVNRASEIASNFVVSQHEYVLCYVKDSKKFNLSSKEKVTFARGTLGNEDQSMPVITFPAGLRCENLPDGTYAETRKIEGSNENVENLTSIIIKNGVLEKPIKLKARWRSSNDMRNFFKNNCQPTKAKINGKIIDIYFDNDRFVPTIKKETFEKIPSLFLENSRGSKYVEELGMGGLFSFPKSVGFIEYLLSFAPKNAKVLDFFAGSGTTGQAVLELNQQDDGQRQFILVQLAESLDLNRAKGRDLTIIKNGIEFLKKQHLPLNIASLANERLRRVLTGKANDGTSDFDWLKNNSPFGDGLDVLNISSVPARELDKGKTAFDVIDETLYGQKKMNLREKIEWVCKNFRDTQKSIEQDNFYRMNASSQDSQ